MSQKTDWETDARRELLASRVNDSGWCYRRGGSASAEVSSLAGLALLATRPRDHGSPTDQVEMSGLARTADWLASIQRPDGSIGVAPGVPSPGWMTPYIMLYWTALQTHSNRVQRAADWLLKLKGMAHPTSEDPNRIAGHDTSIVGWPWVADTHSWLEPTALAVLALGRAGKSTSPRVIEGQRLIRDRAIVSGGWNYGNKAVFGRTLRAQPAPTGLGLLTLAGLGPRDRLIDRAIQYLFEALPHVRASASLGWGLLGLRAWGERIPESDRWLGEAHAMVTGRPDAAPKLACLLLAAGADSLDLFGRTAPTPATTTTGALAERGFS